MFLKRFVYVNWGNIPATEFEFGPVNLFSGGNGSGKTTAADAIQTVMTAAHENLFQYNPGQDETTQRGRGGKRVRTLSSYVLGCDDGSFARLDPTDGYLAAVFYPNEGEPAEPFTAIIAVRAWLEKTGKTSVARQDDAQFFILNGIEIDQNHLIHETNGEKLVVSLSDFHTLMIREFGKQCVEKYETKKAYLRRLYAALHGRSDAVSETEAVAAARAFSRFMAYKPVKGINRFVAEEILEEKDLGEAVRSISTQLKTIHGMERDAAQLVESTEILERCRQHAQSYIENWVDMNVLDYTIAQAIYLGRQQEYLAEKKLQQEKSAEQHKTEEGIELSSRRLEQVREQQIGLEAQRQGIDALREKDELEKTGKELDSELVVAARKVLDHDQILTSNIRLTEAVLPVMTDSELAEVLPGATSLQAQGLAQAVIESGKSILPDIHTLVQRDLDGSAPSIKEQSVALSEVQLRHNQWYDLWNDRGEQGTPLDTLSDFVHMRRNRHKSLEEQRHKKQQEIVRLNSNQVTYPQFVEVAMNAIRQYCPEADPRVLCDHVEVKDPHWQAAIEGYLGGARFSIIVAADYEAEAIRIVRRLPGKNNRAKVIQGEKAVEDSARVSLSESSIVHVLDFSHAVARAYIEASYGSVLRVDSADALRKTRRGVTEEGLGSGGYSMWRCDLPDSELVFGVSARERALAAKSAELEAIAIEWNSAGQRLEQAMELLDTVQGLKRSEYSDALLQVVSTHSEIRRIENLLSLLDLSEHEDLENCLTALNEEYDVLALRKDELVEKKGELRKELETIQTRIKKLSNQQEQNQEKVEQQEEALNAIAEVWPECNVDKRLEAADADARDFNFEIAGTRRNELENLLRTSERKTSDDIQRHNQHCRPTDAIVFTAFGGEYDASLFEAFCGLQRDIDRVYNLLKNNILFEKYQQLKALKSSFNSAFVTHLCHAIYQAISDGKRQINLLNQELQNHRFGADRETFRFASEWIPEYRDYSRFFEEIVKNPGLGDEDTLFEAELSKKSATVLEEIMHMLLDEDEQRALRDLERIADYRNYRRYEIYKEVEGKEPIPLSEYGTGSGGQLETPAYIIRSAAITSAFRFATGKSHLRMVLVDEAFSKMDEIRSREVISYLTESLGLQLVFIMPTSKCGPFMDLISNEFVFAKVPSDVQRGELSTRVLVDRKQCNQARISELWSTHRKSIYEQAELDFMAEFVSG